MEDEAALQVWLVEDNPADATITRTAMESTTFSVAVRCFYKAVDCLDAIAESSGDLPDFIFVDLNMPEMSGTDLVSLIRERGLDMPVYIFSASLYEQNSDRFRAAGADGFLEKPLDLYETIELFEGIFQKK